MHGTSVSRYAEDVIEGKNERTGATTRTSKGDRGSVELVGGSINRVAA